MCGAYIDSSEAFKFWNDIGCERKVMPVLKMLLV